MATTMSVFCLIESKFIDQKSGTEFGDAVFRMGPVYYEKFKWKVFYNTRKGSHSKQCQPFNENDIVHMMGKFTFIKVDDVETIALVLTSSYTFKRNEGGNSRRDLPEQAPVMSFFSHPIQNSHQIIDTVNCVRSTIDVYSAYNNEKTRLNFGIFYNVIKNRWTNIASQWNNNKVFNIVGHYAAAKQNFITVNATEIDYEDISKSSSTSSDMSNSASLEPQANIINRFYESLNSQQSPPTTNSSISDQTTPMISNSSSLPQQIVSNPITPDATNTSSTSTTPQSFNLTYGQLPSHYQPPNSSNPLNPNNSTILPYPQFPYYNPTQLPHHQVSSNSQQISSSNTSNDPNLSQSTPTLDNINRIVIEEIPTGKINPPKKRSKRVTTKKKSQSKKVRTRSDTKRNPNSEQGVMDLALTSLLENSKSDESDNSNNDMETNTSP